MIVLDEFGGRWRIQGGDPAARLVNRLIRANYQLVVLPLKTLATGTVTPPAQQPEDIIHRQRLADCLEFLEAA